MKWGALFLLIIAFLLSSCATQPLRRTDGYLNKYPIILHHGFMSGSAVQWPGAKKMLEENGFQVFWTEVGSASRINIRGLEFAAEINDILKATKKKKVNIIAHSMGGLDARFVISTLDYGNRIASLITVGTPHRGTPVADYIVENQSGVGIQALKVVMDLMSVIVNSKTPPSRADTFRGIRSLTESALKKFNQKNQDDPQVYYESWGGFTGEGSTDPTKLMLIFTRNIILETRGINDGMVPLSSSAWGNFRGVLHADHLDLAGHSFLDGGDFDHKKFLLARAEEISRRGH